MILVDWASMSLKQLEEMQQALGQLCQALEEYMQARQTHASSEVERQRLQQARAILTGHTQVSETERRPAKREM